MDELVAYDEAVMAAGAEWAPQLKPLRTTYATFGALSMLVLDTYDPQFHGRILVEEVHVGGNKVFACPTVSDMFPPVPDPKEVNGPVFSSVVPVQMSLKNEGYQAYKVRIWVVGLTSNSLGPGWAPGYRPVRGGGPLL